jgi:hypothetical protein
MTEQLSYTKFENELRPHFRQSLNKAESTEDVKKFFTYTVQELLKKVLEGQVEVYFEEVSLKPDQNPPYVLSQRLLETESLKSIWDNSDLPHVLERMAESAVNRYKHLEKHPEKTEAKIRGERH